MSLYPNAFDILTKGSAVNLTDDTALGSAPTLVQSAVSSTISGTTATATFTSTPTVGNLMVAVLIGSRNTQSSTPWVGQNGWTMWQNDYGQTVNWQGSAIYTRVVQSGDPSSFTFNTGDTAAYVNFHIFEYSGATSVFTRAFKTTVSISGLTMTSSPQGLANVHEVLFHLPNNSGTPVYSSTSAGTLIQQSTAGNRPSVAINVSGISGGVTTTWTTGGNLTTFSYACSFYVMNTSAKFYTSASITSGTGSVNLNHYISQLLYFEVVPGNTMTGTFTIGACNVSSSKSSVLGVDANSVGYVASTGAVNLSNAALTTLPTYAGSDNIGVAIDPLRRLIWFRKNGGNWNNDVIANQNPATFTGGISLTNLLGGLLPAWGGSATTSAQYKFDSNTWTYTAPSGYQQAGVDVVSTATSGSKYGAFFFPVTPTGTRKPERHVQGQIFDLYSLISPQSPNVAVSGVVKELGSPAPGRKVYIYDTTTGQLLGTATSGSSGEFSILAQGRAEVMVVSLDTPYNALIYTKVVPQ